jgi:hypothetical protein
MDEATGPSYAGSRRHLLRSKQRTLISSVIQKCVGECIEGKLLAPVTYPIKGLPFVQAQVLEQLKE